MRTGESDPADCLFILGLHRPKLAIFLMSVMFISLFLTFNVLYDSAICSLENAASSNTEDNEILLFDNKQMTLLVQNRTGLNTNRVHFAKTSRRLPQAIIIGVRKCGTRALLEMLFLHPMVQKAAGEVHFFDRDENYEKGLDWYRKKMPHSFRGQVTIEKSPSYFVTPEVPERMRAMNSSVKLLLIVREPVTRAISDYTQLRSHSATASSAMTSPPAAQRSFEELAVKPDGSVNLSYRPLAISLYHTFLYRWLDVFPRSQLLVVNGDVLIRDPVPELRKIESFLGLEPRINRNNFYFNHTKGFYCLRNETVDKCLRETKGRKHPKVNSVVVTKLRQFFSEHNQRFYELIGEDLGWPDE